jgi:ceramide glucosyltransferase
MHAFILTIKLLFVGLILSADVFYILCVIAAIKFFREPAIKEEGEEPPVSILVPLHGADFQADENYGSLCSQDYGDYQIVFGVQDKDDPSVPIVRRLIDKFPSRDIHLLICPDTIGENLKVSNLQNMLAEAKHEYLVIVDSDIRVDKHYLRSIVGPLCLQGVGLVTCLYRAAGAPNIVAALEGIGITAEFAPGVLCAWLLEGMTFALGSTIALKRETLLGIEGFKSLANYLADDYMLGNLVFRNGGEVHLARHVVETTLAPIKFFTMIKHQARWARTMRMSRPFGYLGLALTYGTAFALLNAAVDRCSMQSLLFLGSTFGVRFGMAWLIGVHWLKDGVLKRYFWLLPLRDVLSPVIWVLGLVRTRVEWRGRTFKVLRDGKIAAVGEN